MEILSENTLFAKLLFLTDTAPHHAVTEDVVILHLLRGSAELEIGGCTVSMGKDDLYLINMNSVYELCLSAGTLCAILSLSGQRVLNLLGRMSVEFDNTLNRKGESSYLRLEATLWRIYESALREDRAAHIQMLSLYYQLANQISSEWLKESDERQTAFSEQEVLRDRQILQFIHSSYSDSVTLEQLARKLYLTNAYLSKYIKKRFGMNYVDLVSTVRLSHATEALKHSNDSITRIAMTNGFSTVAAFNSAFRTANGISPSEYRKAYRIVNPETTERQTELPEESRSVIEEGIRAFQEREQQSNQVVFLSQEIDSFRKGEERLSHSWKKVINVGTAYNLTRSDYQQQLLYLRERIGFEYVRFWDVFSPELRINMQADPESANFHTVFMIIDFLIDHGMKPFMELGTKPIRISRSTVSAVIDSHRQDAFSSPEELRRFTMEFARRLVSRYGQREVSSWYFEYWKKDPMLLYVNDMKPDRTDDNLAQYLLEFDALCDGIKTAAPNAKVGGGGFTFRSYGEDGIRAILSAWKKQKQLPDFISFNCFCYKNVEFGDQVLHQVRYEDRNYINQIIADADRIMREEDFPKRKIFITEYDFSVSNRNQMNDSCSKAAELLRLILCTMKNTDVLSYWTALDSYAEFSDTTAIIFGGVGLLSKDGIPKPVYYVFDFLNRLDEEILAHTEDYIISRQGPDSFKIVCHNFRGFTDDFYGLEDEDSIGIRNIPAYIRDQHEKRIRITLHNIPNGKYQIRMREVDEQSGSIQSVWKRLNYDSRLDREDVQFVRQMCIPSMWRMEIEVFNGSLDFEIKLAPNSVKYAHFVLKKS